MRYLLMALLLGLATPFRVLADNAPPPSPLREIGHVESLSICSAIVVHANAAIGQTLDNDQQLALAINRLRTTDLDSSNEITRRNGMNDLSTLAGRLRTGAAGGTAEVKRLRIMVAQTTEPTRKAELKAFADALGGALARQRKAGADLDKMLTIIDGRRAVQEVNSRDLVDARNAIAGPTTVQTSTLTRDAGPMGSAVVGTQVVSVDGILHDVADDFTERTQVILSDEGIAADHALGATTGC